MPAMTTKRPYHRTKADWAAATASRLRGTLDDYHQQRIPSSDWRRVRAKAAGMATLRREISRFEQLAQRYRAAGV